MLLFSINTHSPKIIDLGKLNRKNLYLKEVDHEISSPDIVDQASSQTEKTVEMRTLNRQIKLLSKIDKASMYNSIESRSPFLGKNIINFSLDIDVNKNFEYDVVITEVGGTVGDIESLPYLEAIRQMRIDAGSENVLYLQSDIYNNVHHNHDFLMSYKI